MDSSPEIENPVAALKLAGSNVDMDIEAALAALQSQIVAQTEERILSKLNAETLGEEPAQSRFEPAVLGIVARLTEAPPNFHQFVVFVAAETSSASRQQQTDENAVIKAQWLPRMMLAAILMVVGQCATAAAIGTGTFIPSCMDNDQCPLHSFCSLQHGDRCEPCGNSNPFPRQVDDLTGQVYNRPWEENFIGFNLSTVTELCSAPRQVSAAEAGRSWLLENVQRWCEQCVHPIDGTVKNTFEKVIKANARAAMGVFDWFALIFTTFVVAFTISGELRDIQLCSIAVARAGALLAEGPWRARLLLLCGVRRYVFLPMLVSTIPTLVLYRGGDALSVCFNAVAVLFLTEIECAHLFIINIAYGAVMSERARSVFEARGRVKLETKEAAMLLRSKTIHIFIIVISINGGVAFLDPKIAALSFLIGALADALAPHAEGPLSKRIGKAASAGICGGIVAAMIFFLSLSLWNHMMFRQGLSIEDDVGQDGNN